MIIKNGFLYHNNSFDVCDIRITDKIITEIGKNLEPEENELVLLKDQQYVLPGFIDIHTHGAVNVDVNDASVEGLKQISAFFASHGTTSWLCSILTDTEEKTLACIDTVVEYMSQERIGAQLLGIHLEGPFLSDEYRGSMPQHLLQDTFHLSLLQKYQERAKGLIRYITIAPEIQYSIEAIDAIHQLGIKVAIGHSGADYETAMNAIKHGADASTHTMNAMRLIHQHEPAITGAILESDIYSEMICDGLHLHPGIVRLLYKVKGNQRLLAITDSIMAAGLSDGEYHLGVNAITVTDGDAKVSGTNIRAGSTLTLDRALRNVLSFINQPLERIVPIFSTNQASLLGLNKGHIQVGYDADLVILDRNYQVTSTIVSGKVVYD